MDEHTPLHCASEGVFTGEGELQPELYPVGGAADGSDHVEVEDAREWRRQLKAERRARLKAQVEDIIRGLRTPLRDIVLDHVLPRLPVQSLLRFRAVSAHWRRHISAPIFRHRQSHSHRCASGVFRQVLLGVPAYSPFDPLAGGVPEPSLAFLPDHLGVAVLASSGGLLCCAGSLHSYYVCNPSTTEWTHLPAPPPPRVLHHDGAPVVDDGRTAVALVFEPSAANLAADYHLVRAFSVEDCEGLYGFQVFSSITGAWGISSDICAVERLIHGSGVSAGGVAYWRTTMQTVVAYDPGADSCAIFPWPIGYEATAQWQLGEMDGRLCCTCVTDSAVEVYALAADYGYHWTLLAFYMIVIGGEENSGKEIQGSPPVFRSRPWPLRFQSVEGEVLLWVAGRVVALDVASGRVREVYVAPGEPWMDPYAEYVPHISTFAPVFPRG